MKHNVCSRNREDFELSHYAAIYTLQLIVTYELTNSHAEADMLSITCSNFKGRKPGEITVCVEYLYNREPIIIIYTV